MLVHEQILNRVEGFESLNPRLLSRRNQKVEDFWLSRIQLLNSPTYACSVADSNPIQEVNRLISATRESWI